MDFRIALKKNTVLRFTAKSGGTIAYTINKEIGRGGSCIVYDAYYETNAGDKKTVRIKECFPFKLKITRNALGALCVSEEDEAEFKAVQAKMLSDFKIGNSLFCSDGLSDSLANSIDIYTANNTSYIVSVYSPENTLASYKPKSLKECISIIKKTAYTLSRIHDAGYLYLDLKPDNVLIIKGQTERMQLFDFDSLLPVSVSSEKNELNHENIRLSYSKGFAAVELQMGALGKLGWHTDVYGVGALLFYMLFNKTPSAPDCSGGAEYDFSKMNYTGAGYAEYHDKLFFALTEFFRKSLADFYLDRYPDMREAVCKLEEIEKYADTEIPFIRSTPVIRPHILAGREKEMQRLGELLEPQNGNCVFITGMGGIGKSALAREYLSVHNIEFDSILYLQYEGSVMETVTDDLNLSINTVEKNDAETIEEYYSRKLRCISRLTANTNSVLVIDNFPEGCTDDIAPVSAAFPKVIFITRSAPAYALCNVMRIEAIKDKRALQTLFESYLGRCVETPELKYFENILEKTDNHTLALELIAKQIASSYLSLEEASGLVTKYGFTHIAPEKILYGKDLTVYYDTIGNIITALFTVDRLSETKRVILKTVSLLGSSGIAVNMLQTMLALPCKDDMNELKTAGWLQTDGMTILMHPVIREVVRRLPWEKPYISAALKTAEYLYAETRKVWSRESCPMKILDETADSALPESGRSGELPFADSFKKENSVLPSKEEIMREAQKTKENRRKLDKLVRLSENLLENTKQEKTLYDAPVYKELLYAVILNIPRHRESYITEKAAALFREPCCKNIAALMQLYGRITDIYTAKKDYDAAFIKLSEAKKAADGFGNDYAYALYYNMLGWYYDSKLNGAYITGTESEQELFNKLEDASEHALYYAGKLENPNGKRIFVKELLSKAAVLMRSEQYERQELDALLLKANKIAAELAKPFPILISYCDMVTAWYFTLVEHSYEQAEKYMKKSREIADFASETEFDEINQPIIPCANIEFRWGHYEKSARLLLDAIRICEKYEGVVPYIRMKFDLLGFALDVYYSAGDFKMCRKLIEETDRGNLMYADLGIHSEIAPELRAEIFKH